MAFACAAESCSHELWQSKHQEAREASEGSRFFEAVQLINAALEAFEHCVVQTVPLPNRGLLLTEPVSFAKAVQDGGVVLPSSLGVELAGLYGTRADILMSLGGLRRAAQELEAAKLLAPQDQRVQDLTEECAKLQRVQEQGLAEEAEAAVQNKVPALILTGFLGSGKTTLLNRILSEAHGKRFAVIENEFGEIGIDDDLIAAKEDLGAEQIIEMNNGCICCTIRGDLVQGLKKILKTVALDGQRLDGVLIETTGLADPAPVAQTFFADDFIQARMLLDGIITVVDAKHILQHLHEEKPEGVENEAVEQVAFADRILLNKTDLVDEQVLEEVEQEIRKINSTVQIIRTQQSKVDLDQIIGIRAFSLDKVLEGDAGFLDDNQDHQHDSSVSSVGIECDGECDLQRLNAWVTALLKVRGTDIFRMKGILAVKDCEKRFVFQGIHMIFGGQPQKDWGPEEKRCNRLVFIGRNLSREELTAGFKSTLVSA